MGRDTDPRHAPRREHGFSTKMATDRDVVTYVGASTRSGEFGALSRPSTAAAGITEVRVRFRHTAYVNL